MVKDVVYMTCEDKMNNQHELYRMKKNSYLRLKIGFTIQGKSIRLFTNYPIRSNAFIRDKYNELEVINPTPSKNKYDTFDNYAEFKVTMSGAFQFFFTDNGSAEKKDQIGEGYFIVDPRFTFKSQAEDNKDVHFELDGLVMQTYLSKNLGPFPEWEGRLKAAVLGQYNMVHFTPLQELGYSKSCYSLRDQLKVNPNFSTPQQQVSWDSVAKLVDRLYKEHHILSMTDLVYNHTSNDSPWLHEHPECAYNVVNSPHLRPAYLVDRAIWNLTLDIALSKFSTSRELNNRIHKGEQLDTLRTLLWESFKPLRIAEFFLVHIDNQIRGFKAYLEKVGASTNSCFFKEGDLKLIHGSYKRLETTVDYAIAAQHFYKLHRHVDVSCIKLSDALHALNNAKSAEVHSHLERAVENFLANVSYRFLADDGPKLSFVTPNTPLMWNYFYHPREEVRDLKQCEILMDSGEQRIMAFNGWVMGDDPLRSFADEDSNVYLRRELIVWGDSVKLRYGSGPADCPYLWQRMLQYTELTARIFHGVRLDNCHSTPLHVAQAMIDRGRAVRPEFYVAAELFTGREGIDNVFVNKLGINSLIREAQSSANCKDQGRLVYHYGGGLPTGSFVHRGEARELKPSTAHAILYDMTHDNQSPVLRRSPFDLLPTAAMAAAACCAVGSTRGYDEMVPHYIDVVNETRHYSSVSSLVGLDSSNNNYTSSSALQLFAEVTSEDPIGILPARSLLNNLHRRLAAEHFTELFVDQLEENVVCITRHAPSRCRSVIVIAHSSFYYPGDRPRHHSLPPMHVSGRVSKILMELITCRDTSLVDAYTPSKTSINGLPGVWVDMSADPHPGQSSMVRVENGPLNDLVHLVHMPPGSVVVLEVDMTPTHLAAVNSVHAAMASQFNARVRSGSSGHCILVSELMLDEQLSRSGHTTESFDQHPEDVGVDSLRELLADLTTSDLARLMYRDEKEELAETCGKFGAYDVPSHGKLVFCGLQGFRSEMVVIRDNNDLGHPLCANLRAGDWAIDYICNRLEHRGGKLAVLARWMRTKLLQPVKQLPRFLVPSYFEMVLSAVTTMVQEEIAYRLGDTVVFGSSLVRGLAANSVMLCSAIKGLQLPPISSRAFPSPREQNGTSSKSKDEERISVSAGLPHFSEGIWRNWGRDTFIALRGMLLLTHRFKDAAQVILTYAGTLRHGLIPNLLGNGNCARYNARDATWFWLHAVREFELSQRLLTDPSQRICILDLPVQRLYASDSASFSDNEDEHKHQCVADVVQEVLQRHADGIKFRERNAGPIIDCQMQNEGFDVEAGIRNSNKFVYGGNKHNCGTWMDKMGSSTKAGNKGCPATPRDGSAVEIVGLSASVLEWLIEVHNNGSYPFPGVRFKTKNLCWHDWFNEIKEFFDDMFFVPTDCNDPEKKHNRGIYRDTVNSSCLFTDIQFRPNFLIAMTVAPTLFKVEHAWTALNLVERELLGPLGMRTLSPRDWAYRGSYDNSNDSDDRSLAAGFNYHQGPEWLWLTGFYLRARLIFAARLPDQQKDSTSFQATISHVQQVLGRLHRHIAHDKWRSLPELTNQDGQFCPHSSTAQTWSNATALEAVYQLLKLDSKGSTKTL